MKSTSVRYDRLRGGNWRNIWRRKEEILGLTVNVMEEISISQNKLLEKIELQEQNLLGLNKLIKRQNDKLEKYSQKIELLTTEMEKVKSRFRQRTD